ncbi:MAG: hypothetical protein ACPF9I_06460 [Candidatus Thalassarchaeaceae archaeon]
MKRMNMEEFLTYVNKNFAWPDFNEVSIKETWEPLLHVWYDAYCAGFSAYQRLDAGNLDPTGLVDNCLVAYNAGFDGAGKGESE